MISACCELKLCQENLRSEVKVTVDVSHQCLPVASLGLPACQLSIDILNNLINQTFFF